MTTAVTVQQKALTMRSYLSGDKIKTQLAMALPKWLSVDRFIRVGLTAILKNPKLLDCTPESIASSFVQCASLGLEPILGRAHLVPYQNNKKPGRPLEMQMQVGYQGFVDLARRSGDIRDVKPYVVYEKDEFHMEYGDSDIIVHKPFLGSTKDRGKPIGGYCKWIFKDGHVSKHYMSIDDIYDKHRAKSQAYNYAVKSGSKDTPWIEFEEIMIQKTLVKATARWEPASIEAMQAVELDDMSDMGMEQPIIPLDQGEDLPTYDTPNAGDVDGNAPVATPDEFDLMLSGAGYTSGAANGFLEASAKQFGSTVDKVKESALRNKDSFMAALKKHIDLNNASAPTKTVRDEFINLKTKGFAPWLEKFGKEAFLALEEKLQQEIRNKWAGIYENRFPFDEHLPEQESAQDNEMFGDPTPGTAEAGGEPAKDLDIVGENGEIKDKEESPEATYQKDMMAYLSALGDEKFFEVLKKAGKERGEPGGYKNITMIPRVLRPLVLIALKQALDLKLEGVAEGGTV